MLRRAEKVWRNHWGFPFGATLQCGHFVGSFEGPIRSRERIECPMCPDTSAISMSVVYPLAKGWREQMEPAQ